MTTPTMRYRLIAVRILKKLANPIKKMAIQRLSDLLMPEMSQLRTRESKTLLSLLRLEEGPVQQQLITGDSSPNPDHLLHQMVSPHIRPSPVPNVKRNRKQGRDEEEEEWPMK